MNKRELRAAAEALAQEMAGSQASRVGADARLSAFPSQTYRDWADPGFETVSTGGVTWAIPPHGEGDSFATKMLDGWLPYMEIARSRDYAKGKVMLDIGANVGTMSVTRAVLGDFEAIYCAEPEPNNYAALVQTIKANGLEGVVMADRVALSDREGEARFQVKESGMARHHLLPDGDERGITVRVTTLDSWVASLGLDPADIGFIKTDCQGFDGLVMEGATELLKHKHIAWQIEYWPVALAKAETPHSYMSWFIAQHFTHYIHVGKSRDEGVRPTSELHDELLYLAEKGHTELLLLNL